MPASCSEVWQAILVKKLDLDSNHIRDAMSEDARDLLKVRPPRFAPMGGPDMLPFASSDTWGCSALKPAPEPAWYLLLLQPGAATLFPKS